VSHRLQEPTGRPCLFDRAPVMLYWEITRACDLACVHCRAEAVPDRHLRELTLAQAAGFLAEVKAFGPPLPHLVITGGDPIKRPDLHDLVREAVRQGIPVSLAPSATPLLTADVLAALQEEGVAGLSLSLDGSTAARHDRLRGAQGCFARTVSAMREAADLGLSIQINTLVSAETLSDLPNIFDLLTARRIARWSLFFLIPTGRGRLLLNITPEEAERTCHWLATRALHAPFVIASTEAPFYRRVALKRAMHAGRRVGDSVARSFGIRDGNGIAFVSHTGQVSPSGFLPLVAGNVRETSIVDLYRHSPLFGAIRDVNRYRGKCGNCPFKIICGGSRARAYARTGDYLAEDPLCPYQPRVAEAAVRSPAARVHA